jgi:chemotaxis protein methyltransferase CheR
MMKPGDFNPAISDEQFERIRRLIQKRMGLTISASRKRDFFKRIQPFLNQKDDDMEGFVRKLENSNTIDQEMVNSLTIGESYFFRNHPHFAALQREILPNLIAKNENRRRLKIWSAGCSTGEEPYSIAIMLRRDFPSLRDWDITIMATDINTQYLRRAREGKYTKWSFRGVDDRTINAYFKQTNKNQYTLNDSIRNNVSFFNLNLSTIPDHIDAMYEDCDLILCRNVLIYFHSRLATRICEVFSTCLREDGFLLLGHSEAFPSLKDLNTVYSHATYFYRKQTEMAPLRPASRISLVPGLGPYDPEKMIMSIHDEQPAFAGGSLKTFAPSTFAFSPPGPPDALEEDLKRVRDLSMEGELQEATRLIDRLEREGGRLDFRVYFLKALIADQENEPEDALSHLKQAIFLNKQFIIGHYYQGVIAERSGDISAAQRGYRNTCRLAREMRPDSEVKEGGGIRAGRLLEIATERLKELELQHG